MSTTNLNSSCPLKDVPSQFLISLSIFSVAITQMLKCEIQKMGSRRFLLTCPAFERKEQRMQNKNNQGGSTWKVHYTDKTKHPCIVAWVQGPLMRGEETESYAFHSSGLDSTVTSPLQSHSFLPVWTTSFSNLCLILTGSHAGVGTCMLLSYF